LAERESEHKQAEQQAEGEGEADSLLSAEPDPGLYLMTRAENQELDA